MRRSPPRPNRAFQCGTHVPSVSRVCVYMNMYELPMRVHTSQFDEQLHRRLAVFEQTELRLDAAAVGGMGEGGEYSMRAVTWDELEGL